MTRYLTERLLTQDHRRLKKILEESQRTLAGIVDPQALFLNILQTTQEVLQPQWIGLYLQQSDGTKFRRVRSEGLEPDRSLSEILIESPLFKYARNLKNRGELPILLDQVFENELDRSTSQTQREYWNQLLQGLKALGGGLMIPLFDADVILGFVMVKVDRPPEPWGSNWGLLSIIYPYYEQATQTLRSLEVYVRQREKERLAALGEMAAGLAHEIRNPLGAIKGAAQFLDPSQNRPESAFLKVIIEETDRLNRVVSQFLDYSKPASIGFESIDLNDLIKRTVENARLGIPSHIQLSLELPKYPVVAQVVPEQIQQVILNLIHNAVNALANVAEPKILIELSKVSGYSGKDFSAVIVVEDNGCGIPRENIDKIFIPFFTTSTRGTGLGLSICQKIIEAHNGYISVASEVGRFTRFTVILPVSNHIEKERSK
jgi:signal transduction histidine kinase